MSRVAVLGAGSWGTALAVLFAGEHDVRLWCRSDERARAMERARENAQYLPGHAFPDRLAPTADLAHAVEACDVVVSAVPTAVTRSVADEAAGVAPDGAAWITASKGLEADTLLRMSEVLREAVPGAGAIAVLSGPSFAREVAAGQPTAVVIASSDIDAARELQQAVSGSTFRAYATADVIGVELGGAFKNVVAIAAGMLNGLGLGHDPLAALITRGLHEISRLAVAAGAEPQTLAGLSGLGDLVLTCTAPLSRNWRLGKAIAEGQSLDEARASLGQVAEGAGTTRRMVELGQRHGLPVPIAETVDQVLFGDVAARDAVGRLMNRSLKDESA